MLKWFAIPRQRAEFIYQSCSVNAKVTIWGQSSTDDISCPSISFKRFIISSWNFVIRHSQWQRIKTLTILSVQTWIMPLYFIRFESLYPLNNSVTDWSFFFFVFFFFFFFFFFVGGRGGLWSYVHHTVDMKILFLTLSVRLVVLLFFSVHAIFDDPVKVIWWQLQEIDVIAH